MTAMTLGKPEDIDRLLPLIAAFHTEEGIDLSDAARRAAVLPLLEGSPHGAIYVIGPSRAPIGYACVSFGWSLEYGGLDGILDEIYIRPGVRGRGIGLEVLRGLPKALGAAGMKAIHLEVRGDNAKARALYEALHFELREGYGLMSRVL
ncbi:GNAT family N-acetyltransferase [Roseovarius sp. LXJ103]|uniref:GNAT family N-acetyltransferase n=1 Tax=Roseovarius carneus TaxID=2853164 RepID=UPI000D612D98|nr:GNAT family N-acetyltransferase [Roseovarius carneus]MBZ8119100.1 GNAT family N-acetyltransferase [Roseovarius carneus]PWE35264.1 GNAT family N-acetyltransferase [Pelagicola sp. LXJ1103]